MITGRAMYNQVYLYEDGKIVLKAYASPDGKKVRIILPELESQDQCVGEVTGKVRFIDFTRKAIDKGSGKA